MPWYCNTCDRNVGVTEKTYETRVYVVYYAYDTNDKELDDGDFQDDELVDVDNTEHESIACSSCGSNVKWIEEDEEEETIDSESGDIEEESPRCRNCNSTLVTMSGYHGVCQECGHLTIFHDVNPVAQKSANVGGIVIGVKMIPIPDENKKGD
jgi:DNA-directed RNA polymerase subunit RPC12/RpoP